MNKYYYLFVITFLFLFTSPVKGENLDSLKLADNESVRIDSIRISGNDITEEFIILRELTFKQGDVVTGKSLRFNRERVYSLRLFNNVEFIIHHEQNKNILEISLIETWYLYPLPFLYAVRGDLGKTTYGINLSYKNFRGRNETIRALVGIGYDPIYSVSYDNPAIIFEEDIGFSFSFHYAKFTNKSLKARNITGFDYKYKNISQSVAVSKRFNPFNFAFLSIGFTYIETDFSIRGITASGSRIDHLLSAGLSYLYDSRDLKQYSENGIYSFMNITHRGFGINNISYNNFELDFREYRKIFKQLSGKWRIAYRSVFGDFVPYYDNSLLGYQERVRGHYNDIREGKSFLLTSFELSYPVIREWNVSFKLPLLPASLTSARIGIYITSFIDAGDTFNGSDSFSLNHFYSGYGMGITILFLPYNAVRFEYSRNEMGRGEFTIGTGFSF